MRLSLARKPWAAAIGVLAVGVAVSGIGYASVSLTAPASSSSVVACVNNNNSGPLRVVSSASQCTKKEHAVVLQTVGQTSFGVDCTAGQRISDVLAATADGLEPIEINVAGTCTETVEITRDGVTLTGVPGTGAGITAPDADSGAVLVQGARDVSLADLTLSGGFIGLAAWAGSSLEAWGLDITGADTGVQVSNGSSATLNDVVVEHSGQTGIRTGTAGGTLEMHGGAIIYNNDRGLDCDQGDVFLDGVEVSHNQGNHAIVGEWNGCSITINDANVHDNDSDGVVAFGGSAIVVEGGTIADNHSHAGAIAQDGGFVGLYDVTVTGNGSAGALVYSGGTLDVQRAHIDGNHGNGVDLYGGSIARFESSTTINGNEGNGVSLADTSVATINEADVEVTGNDQWGVTCEPSPAVAMVHLPPDPYTGIHDNDVANSGAGDLNCPVA